MHTHSPSQTIPDLVQFKSLQKYIMQKTSYYEAYNYLRETVENMNSSSFTLKCDIEINIPAEELIYYRLVS